MERIEEIKIIIEYLKNDVIFVSQKYCNLLTDRIIKNGKLIEKYQQELNEIEKQ